MKTIHVVFKTHFDLGFTDHAKDVMDNYLYNYIPKALDLAFELNEGQEYPRFIWTTGSYLINEYLITQEKDKVERMEEAIRKGYIKWHAIPLTFQSELVDKSLFEYGLTISKELDKKYNKKTIASKMTDVPGHTIGIVAPLADAGVKFLHIGVNGASSIPEVPNTFLWRDENGKEIIVTYCLDYGTFVEVEGLEDILVFAHTHDNSGPQNSASIIKQFEELKKQYPDAIVKASTLDGFAEKLVRVKDKLPLVTEEIGDTWIHGAATDPIVVSQYKTLVRLQQKWIKEGKVDLSSNDYKLFNNTLLLIPEHTWGMDVKRHCCDFKNYAKEDFKAARERDLISDDTIPPRYDETRINTIPEMKYTTKSWDNRRYSSFEHSWQEQRDYITKAINYLPIDLQIEANEAINSLVPYKKEIDGNPIQVGTSYKIGNYTVKFDSDGSICHLKDIKDKIWADKNHKICSFMYESIGLEDYDYWFKHYMRKLDVNYWAFGDFHKPGIEFLEEIPSNEKFSPTVTSIIKDNNKVLVNLVIDERASEKFGAPRTYTICYDFDEDIDITFSWFDKDANRLPESLWLGINLKVNNTSRYKLNKMGTWVSPLDVVKNGNRNLHAIQDEIKYEAADKSAIITSLDTAVVAPGKPRILEFSNKYESLENGFYFNLFNNVWGTNFRMWYEEDGLFRFTIKLY